MAKLIIIGHIERAEALGTGSLFGYTLSVGWSEANRPNIDIAGVHPLLPWSWSKIVKIHLFGKSNGAWVLVNAFDVVPVTRPADTANIKADAGTRYRGASSIRWPDPSTSADIDKLEINQDKDTSADPWPAHIIEMAGFPFPVAQQMNLSFVFEAKKDLSTYTAFAAAPILAKDLSAVQEMPPAGFQAPFRASDGFATYDQGGGPHPFDIVAASNIVTSVASTVVNGPASQGIGILSARLSDWQQEFLLGASRLFSVPAFVQFIVAPPKDVGLDMPKDTLIPTLVAAGVACLRDIVSVGRDAAPLGGFPRVRELLRANPAVGQELFNSAYQSAFPTMEAWTSFLKKNIAGTDNLSVWNLIPRNSGSASQAVSDSRQYSGQLKRDFATVLAPVLNEGSPGVKGETPPIHKPLMTALWNQILGGLRAAPKTQIDSFRGGLPGALDDISYTSLWLDETLGMFWDSILSKPDAFANPLLARTVQLSTYFVLSRLGLPITAPETPADLPNIWRNIPTDWRPQGNELTAWNDAKPLLLKWLGAWQASVSASFDPSRAEAFDQSSGNPLPVHLQYSSFAQDKSSVSEAIVDLSQPDLLREIRGVGLLVKEQDSPQWTVVNLNAAIDVKGIPCVTTPVGFPLRSGYVAKLRRGLIAYEGEPLSGGTALDNIDGLQNTVRAGFDGRSPLLWADFHRDVRTPQLKYGRNFSFATFSVLNSGILPPLLRAAATEPRDWKASSNTLPAGWKATNSLYQRTTRIGALRVMRDGTEDPNQPAALPTIPAGTYPRARDIDWLALWGDKNPQRPPDPDRLNLVLLSPNGWSAKSTTPKSSYTFRVRLPEVTWREWSAWGASLPSRIAAGLPDPNNPIIPPDRFIEDRAAIITECFKTSLGEKAMPAVDDPCLARLLYVELYEESGGKLTLKSDRFVPIGALAGTSGRARYQAKGARVVCRHGNGSDTGLALRDADQEVTVVVREGSVAIVRIWACVPVEYQIPGTNSAGQKFEKMFALGTLPPDRHPRVLFNKKDYLLVSSYDILVESATAALPTPTDLFNAFRSTLRIRESDPSMVGVTSSIPNTTAGTSLKDPGKFLFIGSVQAKRQSWRWEGRPVPLHPSLIESLKSVPPAQVDSELKKWNWTVYAERPDGESDPIQMPVRRDAPVSVPIFESLRGSGCRYFESSDGMSAASGPGGPRVDLRGAHFRFSVQVTSRYESLMNLADVKASRFAHPDLPDPSNDEPLSLAWTTTFVPSRVNSPTAPKLRLLLPLTEADGREENQAPSLLAVFDDIFYDEAGLGDTLETEIESIPVEGDGPRQFVLQTGKDVLQRNGDEKPSLLPYGDPAVPPIRISMDATHPGTRWAGPIGNFRDFTNRYAKFLATSFIIPAPEHKDKKEVDVRGWFASIRFRRTVRTRDFPPAVPKSVISKDYTDPDLLQWNATAVSSKWTDSCWVQYLGSFSRFDGFEHRVAKLIPSVDAAGVLTLAYEGRPVELKATSVPNFPNSRRLYALVTQRVFDFRGQYNQELPVAIAYQDPADPTSWRCAKDKVEIVKQLKANFRVRIIEVAFATAGPQATQPPANPDDLFAELFRVRRVETADVASLHFSSRDAAGSFVRFSEPANSVDAAGVHPTLCEPSEASR
jgi:hypothetical protein